MRLRSHGAATAPSMRLRVAALGLIAFLAVLDVVGAAYLRELWTDRHAEQSDSIGARAARLGPSDGHGESPASTAPAPR